MFPACWLCWCVCYILANYALGLVDSSEERHGFFLLLSRSMLYRVFLWPLKRCLWVLLIQIKKILFITTQQKVEFFIYIVYIFYKANQCHACETRIEEGCRYWARCLFAVNQDADTCLRGTRLYSSRVLTIAEISPLFKAACPSPTVSMFTGLPAPDSPISYLISGFLCDVDEVCALLTCYAACNGNYLPTFQDNLSVPSSRVKNSSLSIGSSGITFPFCLKNYGFCCTRLSNKRVVLGLPNV